MENRPGIFIRILIPFATGIWISQSNQFAKLNFPFYSLAILIFILTLIFNVLYRLLKVYNYKIQLALLVHLLFFLMGCLSRIGIDELSNPRHFAQQKADFIKIYIEQEPHISEKTIRLKSRISKCYLGRNTAQACGGLLITVLRKKHSLHQFEYGKVYLIPSRYSPVPSPANPAEFDTRRWLANQNIYHQTLLSEDELIPVSEQAGSALISLAISFRKKQIDRYRRLISDDNAFAVASTLILGYRVDLNASTLNAYAKTGTIHALSVSGMHVGMVYIVLEWIFSPMNKNEKLKWLKLLLIILFIWSYTLISGCSSAVLRAALMLTVYLLAKTLGKDTSGIHIVALSAFFLLFYDPFLLRDISFQLSYLAVGGLVYLQPKIYQLLFFRWNSVQLIWKMISISIAAQVFTFPLSVYYFHQFPIYFLIANLFISLPVFVLMYFGLSILLFNLHWLAPPFEWIIKFMNKGLEQIASLPYASIDGLWLSKTELCFLCLLIVFLIRACLDKKKDAVFAAILLLTLLNGLYCIEKLKVNKQKRILFFSLFKGYAVAFIKGREAVLMTDRVPGDREFIRQIQPSLDQLGINHTISFPLKEDVALNQFIKKGHVLRFQDFHILLLDSTLNYNQISDKPFFDAVWIHKNNGPSVVEVRKYIRFKHFWVDATNFKSNSTELTKFKASLINLKKYKPDKN